MVGNFIEEFAKTTTETWRLAILWWYVQICREVVSKILLFHPKNKFILTMDVLHFIIKNELSNVERNSYILI